MRSTRWVPLCLVFVLGCGEALEPGAEPADDGVITEALRFTPEEVGVLRLLNLPSTDVSLLDVDAGLDRRAATGLVAHRDGADGRVGTRDDDPFDSLAEVDAVPYVGPSALNKLVTFAETRGLVPGPNDVLGTFDTVTFSVAEADRALDLVNEASESMLDDDVALDPRAARAIVAARPIDTMAQLAAVYYVGPAAMRAIREFTAAPAATCEGIAPRIGDLSLDMWFTSESDYRLEARTFEVSPTDSTIVGMLGLPAGTPVDASQSVDRFFLQLTYSNEEPAVEALRAYLESELTDLRVLRVGEIQVQVYVVGTTRCGAGAGVSTISIET